jgi:murein L,D-transpeptidase YcbB/YkuD
MVAWRLAESLIQLRKEVNTKWPRRLKVSDGSIGNTEHSARESDHNPDDDGVVKAIDITHDPMHGPDSEMLAQSLLDSRDPRIKYVISNRKIGAGAAGPEPWLWRPYSGKNPHNHHVHISVRKDAVYFDDKTPWDLKDVVHIAKQPGEGGPPRRAALYPSRVPSEEVRELQKLLNFDPKDIDGVFGPKTEAAVLGFQKARGLVDNGVVGSYTWEKLLEGSKK